MHYARCMHYARYRRYRGMMHYPGPLNGTTTGYQVIIFVNLDQIQAKTISEETTKQLSRTIILTREKWMY